ncbi:hypothetical protein LCGC14_1124700 [marine sediment metagenome]|uniref:Uncharacterized protein n=2 Tax=marine sediment metagenome TaxID=412755 RepID=A0A0F9M7P5_9ZZZZ
MTTRYQEKHYEDVAQILAAAVEESEHEGPTYRAMDWQTVENLAHDFVALFVTDNPLVCRQCGDDEGSTARCLPDEPTVEHSYDGFDREQFLTACGLESEG